MEYFKIKGTNTYFSKENDKFIEMIEYTEQPKAIQWIEKLSIDQFPEMIFLTEVNALEFFDVRKKVMKEVKENKE